MPNFDARVSLLSSLLLHGIGVMVLFQVPVEEVFSASTIPVKNAPLAIQLVSAPQQPEIRKEPKPELPQKEPPQPKAVTPSVRPLPAALKKPLPRKVEPRKVEEVQREKVTPPTPRKAQNTPQKASTQAALSHAPSSEVNQELAAREILNYESMIVAMIAKQKRYPARAERLGLEGVVGLSIAVSREGSLIDCSISEPSKYSFFDEEVLRMARAAAPFPKAPDTIQSSAVRLKIPVQFQLQ